MQSSFNRTSLAALATAGLMIFALAACGEDNDGGASVNNSDSDSSSQASSSQSPPAPVASIEALTGQQTAITLDKGFTDALTALKLTPGTIGDAALQGNELSFPITGGNVTVFEPGTVSPYVIGQLQHVSSGLSLTAGPTEVQLVNLNVDPGVSRVYGDVLVNGEVAAESAYLFQLDGRTLKPLQTQGTQAILKGTKVMISPDAAPLLNDTFKTNAVKAGLLVGIAEITVNTQ